MATNDPRVAIEAGDTLESLVDQFADQFAFLRELIQNSIDAGSTQVYVDFEFKPYEDGKKGIFIIRVEDTGEGMNREIIDTQLTRLFSSSKENDMTKIGKFGIGFVSVFALKPNAVIVDTGRDGESWRIFFKEDKTFDRIVLDRPVDGTKIQFIKELSVDDFHRYRERSIETINKWCKHSEAELYVDGEKANQQFELQHPFAVLHEAQGTTISLAPSMEDRPFYGFYNRGLTLHEGNETVVEGVSFKIRSRYLEHTLTRDNVIKDVNYDKAMAILQEAVDKKLRPTLFQAAAKQDRDEIFGYCSYRLKKLPDELALLPIVPLVNGARLSLKELRKEANKYKEVLYESEENWVTEGLKDDDRNVIRWRGPEAEPGLGRLLSAFLEKIPLVRANQAFGRPRLRTEMAQKDLDLIAAAVRLLNRAGSPYKQMIAADFDYPGSGIGDKIYLAQSTPGDLQRVDGKERKNLLSFLFGRNTGKMVILNMHHELVEPVFRLRESFPALAAYLLAKSVTLADGLDPATEARLIEAAMEDEPTLAVQLK